jgi:hypothetical protein
VPAQTLYFDRNVGTRLPDALRLLGLKNVVHHNSPRGMFGLKTTASLKYLFAQNEKDDVWLKYVGERNWVVLTQDRKFHNAGFENELSAIKQFNVGCFYIWGAEAKTWDKMIAFCRAFEHIIRASETTARPYIFDVEKSGKLHQIMLP